MGIVTWRSTSSGARPGIDGDDLHHLGGDVGVGVDGLLLEGPDAPAHHSQRQEQHHPPQAQGGLNDEVHRSLPPCGRSRAAALADGESDRLQAADDDGLQQDGPLAQHAIVGLQARRAPRRPRPRNSPICTSTIRQVPGSAATSA